MGISAEHDVVTVLDLAFRYGPGFDQADAAVWTADPTLHGCQLVTGPADAALRQEWLTAYNAQLAKRPLPPAVALLTAVSPPAGGPVLRCAGVSASVVTVSGCQDVKNHIQEGDIVLRGERSDNESEFNGKVSGCDHSHASIVARDAAGDLVVVDAQSVGPLEQRSQAAVLFGEAAGSAVELEHRFSQRREAIARPVA